MKRQILRIDEDKCNGCGECLPSCAEGALQIVNGKARLIEDKLCDGLGACLGHCPQDALIIEERVADAFDEEAVEKRLEELKKEEAPKESFGCGCPGTMARSMATKKEANPVAAAGETPSELTQWPVQLTLLNPNAAYFKNADLLVAADCAPLAYADFHKDFLRGRAVAIGCPKLDEGTAYVEKLAEIIRVNDLKSITVVHMEVPCCSGLISIVREAVKRANIDVPVETVRIALDGAANTPQKLSA